MEVPHTTRPDVGRGMHLDSTCRLYSSFVCLVRYMLLSLTVDTTNARISLWSLYVADYVPVQDDRRHSR